MIMQKQRKTVFWVFFNAVSILVLLCLLHNSLIVHKWNSSESTHARILQEIHEHTLNVTSPTLNLMGHQVCTELVDRDHILGACDYLLAHPECGSKGFFNYMDFFYCDCKNYTPIGFLVLVAWLAVLFYLLGNTAADYFCCSLEKLSDLLKLSPTVAGVTLLPLGNGASDVFAGIANFLSSSGSNGVGFDGILGGAIFITCVVGGVVSLSVANKKVQVDKVCFLRDLSFFLFGVVCLALILAVGEVNIWGALAFVSIYIVYAIFVALNEILPKESPKLKFDEFTTPMLHVVGSFFSCRGEEELSIDNCAPLLDPPDQHNPVDLSVKLPPWIWNTDSASYSEYFLAHVEDDQHPRCGSSNEQEEEDDSFFSLSKLCSLLEIPLHVPRRLTIPVVDEYRWSKPYAICSVFLSPVLLTFLWAPHKLAYFLGLSIGLTLALLTLRYTSSTHPPQKCLFLWVFGGFFMCVIWSYIIANELVSLLVAFGSILGVDTSMLALTVLAWGNSMGDLMSNTSLANSERNGVQMAMSGCFAGPMFNTLVGLGVSLLLGVWYMGSSAPYIVPRDVGLFITLGFLAAALIWALVVLPLNDMRPNKTLAAGLLTVYLMFLCVHVWTAMSLGS